MKVLYTTYPTAFQDPGGGQVQLLKTKEYLEKKQIQIKLFNSSENKITDFDLLHNFSLHSNCEEIVSLAHAKKIPIAVSPIFWPSLKYALKAKTNLKHKIKMAGFNFLIKHSSLLKPKSILEKSSIAFPNSHIEGDMLVKNFKINKDKIHVVPNGVDEKFSNGKPSLFEDKYKLENFVLCVGRIEPRKNQLNLIKALSKDNIKLVIIGKPTSEAASYYKECKKHAGKNVYFLGELKYDSSLLISAYAATSVFALPSWYETPGLAALEAGLAGANIVITSKGSTKEYFEDHAWYVNPDDIKDIRNKVIEAFNTKKSKKLYAHVKRNYLWSHVADKTLEGYKKIIA